MHELLSRPDIDKLTPIHPPRMPAHPIMMNNHLMQSIKSEYDVNLVHTPPQPITESNMSTAPPAKELQSQINNTPVIKVVNSENANKSKVITKRKIVPKWVNERISEYYDSFILDCERNVNLKTEIEECQGIQNYLTNFDIDYDGEYKDHIQIRVIELLESYLISKLHYESKSKPVTIQLNPVNVEQKANQPNIIQLAIGKPDFNEYLERCTLAMEKSLSTSHQDVAKAILTCKWSPFPNVIGLMKDAHSKDFYAYDYDNKLWDKCYPEMLERNGRNDLIERLINSRKGLRQQINGSNNPEFKERCEITCKKITGLLDKLGNNSYINSLWAMITKIITREIQYKPYHTDMPQDQNLHNTFPGFKATKVMLNQNINDIDSRLNRLLTHIFVVWAKQNIDLYYYILSWLAHPLRSLTRTNVALVIIGPPGCGKSMIFEFLRTFIYGDKLAANVDDFDPILQRFNNILTGKMLICVDETNTTDSKHFSANFNKFKPKITGDTTQIERKGIEIGQVENFNTFAICSNHDIPIKIEDRDRRYVPIDCSDFYVGNKEYFTSLIADCFNQEVGNLFYSYLRSDALVGVLKPLLPLPQTEAKTRIVEALRPKHLTFFDEVFLYGGYSIPCELIRIEPNTNKIFIASKDLFDQYRQWCKETGNICTYKSSGFFREIYKYPGLSRAERKTIDHHQHYCAYIDDHHETTLISKSNGLTGITTQKLSTLRSN